MCASNSFRMFKYALLIVSLTLMSWQIAPVMASPTGVWCVEGGASRVEISLCGNALCGRIVWLQSAFDRHSREVRDTHNPDAALRHRKVLGLTILRGLKKPSGRDRVWQDGTIYDPNNGKTYTCRLTLGGENRLRLRGFVGIPLFGRTTVWTRASAANHACP